MTGTSGVIATEGRLLATELPPTATEPAVAIAVSAFTIDGAPAIVVSAAETRVWCSDVLFALGATIVRPAPPPALSLESRDGSRSHNAYIEADLLGHSTIAVQAGSGETVIEPARLQRLLDAQVIALPRRGAR